MNVRDKQNQPAYFRDVVCFICAFVYGIHASAIDGVIVASVTSQSPPHAAEHAE